MSTPELTTEDQLVADLVAHWAATPPEGHPADVPILHFGRVVQLPVPALIIGHEGSQRIPHMDDATAWVSLRIALRTAADDTPQPLHRQIAGRFADALRTINRRPGPLPLTYLHDVHREAGLIHEIDDARREVTVLSYRILATRMAETS